VFPKPESYGIHWRSGPRSVKIGSTARARAIGRPLVGGLRASKGTGII
jgi:hypothetical protein